jgi:hypothetical protein
VSETFIPAVDDADLADLALAHEIERFHRLGPRVLTELLVEIGARYLIRQPLEDAVRRYVDRLEPIAEALST